jgi:hypothetical protein
LIHETRADAPARGALVIRPSRGFQPGSRPARRSSRRFANGDARAMFRVPQDVHPLGTGRRLAEGPRADLPEGAGSQARGRAPAQGPRARRAPRPSARERPLPSRSNLNGSGLVRQPRGSLVSLGSAPRLPGARAPLAHCRGCCRDAIVFPSAIFFLKSLSCSSVTVGAPGAPAPTRNSGRQPRTSRQGDDQPAKVVVVDMQKQLSPIKRRPLPYAALCHE